MAPPQTGHVRAVFDRLAEPGIPDLEVNLYQRIYAVCDVNGDVYVCDSSVCGVLGSSQVRTVRDRLGAFLGDVDPDGLSDTILVVDQLLTYTYEDDRRPLRLQVQRREQGRACWIEVSGCSIRIAQRASAARHEPDIGLRLLDSVCTAWGAVPGDAGHTLWAEVPLLPAQ